LQKALASKEAEFIALYGRRRVGKTYLIRQFFRNSACIFLKVTGQKDGSLKEQLLNFSQALAKTFFQGLAIQPFKDWREAFEVLTLLIKKIAHTARSLYFWMSFLG